MKIHLHQSNNGFCSWWSQISCVWVILVSPTFGFSKFFCSWSAIHFAIMLLEKDGEKLNCHDGNAVTKSPQQVCGLHTPSTLRPHPWVGREAKLIRLEAKLPEFLLANIRSGRNEDFGLVAVILMFSIFFLCFCLASGSRSSWEGQEISSKCLFAFSGLCWLAAGLNSWGYAVPGDQQ